MQMPLYTISSKSLLILGFGVEGYNTYRFLRKKFPEKVIGIADRSTLSNLAEEQQAVINSDSRICPHLQDSYLSHIKNYDLIFRTPSIPAQLPELANAKALGAQITSETDLFFNLCNRPIIGITGTKGKSTTASLIYTILNNFGIETYLVGNIGPALGGSSPLLSLDKASTKAVFVYELSSFQLEDVTRSPNVAILLNVVPEHIDHHGSMDQYISAKSNIAKFQSPWDYLIYNADGVVPSEIAGKSNAIMQLSYSTKKKNGVGCYVDENQIVVSSKSGEKPILSTDEVLRSLPAKFDLNNVLPAIIAAKLFGVPDQRINSGISEFSGLRDRFDCVGTFREITFYNAAIATIPEATIAHIEELHPLTETIILGGFDRGADYSQLAKTILEKSITTVLLFPDSGMKIWKEILRAATGSKNLPRHVFLNTMEEAVRLAYQFTPPGKVCLHSPATPSRGGTFRDYAERSQSFREWVETFANR